MAKTTAALERFHAKTKPAGDGSDCILWTAYKLPKGYGRFGDNYRTHLAHRWIYEQTHGVTLGRDDFVLHSCDTPSCVNVEHLRQGVAKENTADMDTRGRRAFVGPEGESNSKARLTAAQVLGMRARHAAGGASFADLAREFGISDVAARKAVTGETWRHI